jgi:hypothetical protein
MVKNKFRKVGAFGKTEFGASKSDAKAKALRSYGGLTFFADYSGTHSVDAVYSVGSGTGTFTRSTDATHPAMYVQADKTIITQTTNNGPRWTDGYYDATGAWHKPGLMMERASTNCATYSNVPENAAWTKANITAEDADAGSYSLDNTATSPRLVATSANGTFVQAYAITGDTQTFTASCWLKRKTGTGKIYLGAVEDGTGKTEKTITTNWTRHYVTATTDGDSAGKDPAFYLEIATNTDAVYIWGCQLEALPYATSFIPTTTAALTRNNEVLSYVSTGNRTQDKETIVLKIAPCSTFANDGKWRTVLYDPSSSGGTRLIDKGSTNTGMRTYPNSQTGQAAIMSTVNLKGNTSYVFTLACDSSNVNPNSAVYVDGVADGTDNTNWASKGFATNWLVGSGGVTDQFDGVLQSVAMFSDVKSAAAVKSITEILNL